MTQLYPLFFEPVLKEYIWGGRNLKHKLGRSIPAEGVTAESWEIAAHQDGTTAVKNGPLTGRLLTDLLDEYQLDLIGTHSEWALERQKFPLLVKLLDAQRNLSVQVHPDDDYAQKHEGNELGKTEMWVVLHAEANAEVILGVTEGTTPEQFRAALAAGNLEPYLHHIPVKAGDYIDVPAGSLHAIMGGLLLVEVQQNSNTTYRVYDWNRLGADGQPRPLHIEKALEVIDFEQVEPERPHPIIIADVGGVKQEVLCQNRYFTVERVTIDGGCEYTGRCDGGSFEIWGATEGAAVIHHGADDYPLEAVQFALLPAVLGEFTVTATVPTTCLHIYVAKNS